MGDSMRGAKLVEILLRTVLGYSVCYVSNVAI